MAAPKAATQTGESSPGMTGTQQADGPHAPVSNEAEEAARVSQARLSKPPAEGDNPQTTSPRNDGTEAVGGYAPVAPRPAGEMIELEAARQEVVLPDIGEASFGGPAPETIIGQDDRVQITNTTVYPWRVHASLTITAADNSTWIGTAWFISPRTLITAGHCVYIKNSGVPGRDGWVKSIKVMPGRNGSMVPYGPVTSTSFRTVTAWANSGDHNYDYGAIILPSPLGNTVGWLAYGVYPDAELETATGNISGYPGDKPQGTQWYGTRKIASVTGLKVFYEIDTAGGQSGSAVYRIVDGKRYAIAIHAYGLGSGATSNSGTRITPEVYNNLAAWSA